MKIIEKRIDINEKNIPNNSIFLDIETTGFNRTFNQIYLMGTLAKEGENYIFRQYLTNSKADEKELLKLNIDLINKYESVITFNGDNFDLPYIQRRAKKHQLDFEYRSLNSLDIYREIKNKTFLLDLENHKLKTIEKYLGIEREDTFSGGELIQLYYDYIAGDKKLEDVLLRHNKEDVINMPKLFRIFPVIEERNKILIEDYVFNLEEINLNKNELAIKGTSNISKAYFNLYSTELKIIDYNFDLKAIVKEENYNEKFKCIYIEKNGMNLKCHYDCRSPDEILLLKYDKEILYKNAFDYFKKFLENIL